MMAKGKKEKTKRTYRKPVPSTQQNIPIRDVYNGVAITAGKKFVKLVKVKPQPFFLKKIGEQNHISDFFANLLKTGPDELHIKSMSLPSDLSYQIAEIERCMESEKDEECRKMGGEYIQRLKEAQSYGISRRFFMSFPYTGRQGGLKSINIDEIVRSLDNDEYRLRSSLAECGNETISEYPQDPNMDILKTLYMVYNRDSYLIEPFENRVQEINSRYLEKMKDQYFYIPIQDYIAPSRISYDSNRYLVINNTYYSFLYIPSDGYRPRKTGRKREPGYF